jgi:hypothetical protein
MNWVLPVVIGTTTFAYVHSFNHIMKLYAESGHTMDWNDFINQNLKHLKVFAF